MTTAGRTLNLQAATALVGVALALLALLALVSGRSIGPAAPQGDGVSSAAAETEADAPIAPDYGHLPLAFEPNTGITDRRVDFLARGQVGSLFLSPTEATLALHRGDAEATALRMRLLGSDPSARPAGEDRLAGTVNYLRGSDRSGWRTAIPTYGEVSYASVYPGIGIRYYGSEGRLEYDFELAPHADPRLIALRFDGARTVSVAANGDLLLRLPGGTVRERAPVAYQRIGGERRRVAARYALDGDRVRFALGDYRRSRPLTIDPLVLAYSTYVGGDLGVDDGYDESSALAVDSAGSAYITGDTQSIDFPTTPGAFDPSKGLNGADDGVADAFVTKLAADGASVAYSTHLGGAMADFGRAIAVDAAGNAYVTGHTASGDFPTTPGAFDTVSSGLGSFVTKLAPDGQDLVWSTFLDGSEPGEFDRTRGIAVDSAGSPYIAGVTFAGMGGANDFPTTPGAFDTTFNGGADLFVTKFAPAGGSLVYSTLFGGTRSGDDSEDASELAVDSSGQRLRNRRHELAGLPDHARRVRHHRGWAFRRICDQGRPEWRQPRLLDLPRRDRGRHRRRSRRRLGGRGVRGRPNELGRLPDHAGRVRHGPRRRLRRLRHQARPDGGGLAYSTYLGGGAADDAAPRSRSARPGAPTSPGSPNRATSRPRRGRSTPPTPAAGGTST